MNDSKKKKINLDQEELALLRYSMLPSIDKEPGSIVIWRRVTSVTDQSKAEIILQEDEAIKNG